MITGWYRRDGAGSSTVIFIIQVNLSPGGDEVILTVPVLSGSGVMHPHRKTQRMSNPMTIFSIIIQTC